MLRRDRQKSRSKSFKFDLKKLGDLARDFVTFRQKAIVEERTLKKDEDSRNSIKNNCERKRMRKSFRERDRGGGVGLDN